MTFFGEKIILKIQLTVIALILINGMLFAQKSENNLKAGTDIKAILFSSDKTGAIDEESSFKSIYEKVNSYTCTETINVNFCIPKIIKAFSRNLRNSNQTAGMQNHDLKKEYMPSRNNFIPLNHDTKICYSVKTPGIVTLKIYDAEGKEISTIVNEFQSKGEYEVHFSANTQEFSDLTSGIYFYTIEVNNFAEIRSRI